MGASVGFDAVVDIPPVASDADKNADSDGEECEACLPEVEVVHTFVDEREGLEEAVEDAVDQRGVDSCERDTRIEHDELEGPPEGLNGDVAGCEVGLVDLGLALEAVVSGEFAEAFERGGGCSRSWFLG